MRSHPKLRSSNGDKPDAPSADHEANDGQFEAKVTLTHMENQVLTLVARAKTNKEIAHALHISPATVKRHVENLLRKLNLRNRVEAAVYRIMVDGCRAPDRSKCAFELWRKKEQPDG